MLALYLLGHSELGRRYGLYAEQMDGDGTALGNDPQAFSHLGLVEAAVDLSRAGDGEALQAWALREPTSLGVP